MWSSAIRWTELTGSRRTSVFVELAEKVAFNADGSWASDEIAT